MIERSKHILISTGLNVAFALLVAVGCSGPNEYESIVTGTVTVDGELANSGLVTFHPLKDGVRAIGRINPDGSFSLRTGQGDLREADGGTVIPGEYIVTVSITGPSIKSGQPEEGRPPTPGPPLIAAKYASTETSDLKQVIKPGSQVIVLELERVEMTSPPDEPSSGTPESQEPVQTAIAPTTESAPASPSSDEDTSTGSSTKGKSP